MKILRHGRKYESLWVGKCCYCGAIVETSVDETNNIILGNWRNNYEDSSFLDCPECKAIKCVCVSRKSTKHGKHIQNELKNITENEQ